MENDLRLIGGRIRQARKQQGLRLSDLSDSAGCSESMLSKIENGKVTPSLPTLRNIARALDTKISTLLCEDSQPCLVIRRADREVVPSSNGSGINTARLIPGLSRRFLDAYVLEVPPGAEFNNGFLREGETLGYILTGALSLGTDGQEHELINGDAFHIRPEMGYTCTNNGQDKTSLLVVTVTPGA